MRLSNFIYKCLFCFVSAYLLADDLHFSTKQFSKNFSNLLFTRTRRFKNSCFYGSRTTAPKENYPKTLKLTLTLNRGAIFLGGNCPNTFSTNLLYNRIILYNRTIKTIGFIYICRCGLRSF